MVSAGLRKHAAQSSATLPWQVLAWTWLLTRDRSPSGSSTQGRSGRARRLLGRYLSHWQIVHGNDSVE